MKTQLHIEADWTCEILGREERRQVLLNRGLGRRALEEEVAFSLFRVGSRRPIRADDQPLFPVLLLFLAAQIALHLQR